MVEKIVGIAGSPKSATTIAPFSATSPRICLDGTIEFGTTTFRVPEYQQGSTRFRSDGSIASVSTGMLSRPRWTI